MKNSKLLVYGLLLALPLVVLASVRLLPLVKASPPLYTVTVFTDGSVDDTDKKVPVGKNLSWVPLDHQQSFAVQFSPSKTPFAVGARPTTINTGDVNTVIGDKSCPNGSWTDNNCYFPYVTCSKANAPCSSLDPGVRVVPPSQSSGLLFWLATLAGALAYTAYAAFRISTRNRASDPR